MGKKTKKAGRILSALGGGLMMSIDPVGYKKKKMRRHAQRFLQNMAESHI